MNQIQSNGVMSFNYDNNLEERINELDEYTLKCFDLEYNNSIDYILNVQIPLLAGNNSYKEVSICQLKEYASVITKYFDKILIANQQVMSVKIYDKIKSNYSAIEFKITDINQNDKMVVVDTTTDSSTKNLNIFTKFMVTKINDMFYQIKDVVNFEEKSFYILKTNESKNWHKAIAELNLSDVIDSILSQEEESK